MATGKETLGERHGALWRRDRWYALTWLLAPQAIIIPLLAWLWLPSQASTGVVWGQPVPNEAPASAPAPAQQGAPVPSSQSGAGKIAFEDPVEIAKRTYTKTFPVAGSNLLLPEGEWRVFSWWRSNPSNSKTLIYLLARIDNRRLMAFARIYVQESLSQPPGKWAAQPDCAASFVDNIYVEVESCRDGELNYWTLKNRTTHGWSQAHEPGSQLPEPEKIFAKRIYGDGYIYSQDYVRAEFFRSSTPFTMIATFAFAPHAAISAPVANGYRNSEWHASRIRAFPDKMEFANKIKDWSKAYWPHFKLAFDEVK